MSEPSRALRHARALRRAMTDAERQLWSKLRNRRFAKFKFRRQVPIGPYILDFACFAQMLAIELDGGQHARQTVYDAKRSRWLEAQGWRILRFWNHQLGEDGDAVEEAIWIALTGTSPYGNPSPGRSDTSLRPPSPTRGEG
ncbi:MAG: endonuclease domain-containing protein [Pirellulales bacterium]